MTNPFWASVGYKTQATPKISRVKLIARLHIECDREGEGYCLPLEE